MIQLSNLHCRTLRPLVAFQKSLSCTYLHLRMIPFRCFNEYNCFGHKEPQQQQLNHTTATDFVPLNLYSLSLRSCYRKLSETRSFIVFPHSLALSYLYSKSKATANSSTSSAWRPEAPHPSNPAFIHRLKKDFPSVCSCIWASMTLSHLTHKCLAGSCGSRSSYRTLL